MPPLELDLDACRGRQHRLRHVMQREQLDWAILTQRENIQWLTGARFPWYFQPTAALRADGHVTLVAPQKRQFEAAADQILRYEAQWHSTLRNDQRQACSEILRQGAPGLTRGQRIGVEFSSFSQHLAQDLAAQHGGTFCDIEPDMYYLRRRKDADELQLIRRAIAATGAMYERARTIVRPGISELAVFSELQSVAVDVCGEMLTGTGNDYQCGSRGGPPRNERLAETGELYILDLGPAFRGYFADNCRTLAVTDPSPMQHEAWTHVIRVFDHVQHTVKPGKRAQELFHEAQAILDAAPLGVFNHHLGHGVGLFPHEAPHLNPHWDDTFEVGDVFAVEPGLYAPELRSGLRIENDYLVTEQGIELLTDFPLNL